jgi:tRNA(His) 5'-end guanylyltransferase
MDQRSFADRMREMQMSSSTVLPARSYTILQLDGKAFHTWTKGLETPFDVKFINGMNKVTEILASKISGVKFAYVQSDEISLLLTDFDTPETQPFYGNRVQKIVSTSAGLASAILSREFPDKDFAVFDARLFTAPDKEAVIDWFNWRQADAMKNSVRAVAHARFSHKQLNQKNTLDVREMLREFGDPWEDYSDGERNGRLIVKRSFEDSRTFFHKKEGREKTVHFTATRWVSEDAPVFRETQVLQELTPDRVEE